MEILSAYRDLQTARAMLSELRESRYQDATRRPLWSPDLAVRKARVERAERMEQHALERFISVLDAK